MSATGIHCFGYGSLVNRETHNFENCEPSKLPNWRRRWCHRVNGAISATSLSIEKCPGIEIQGLLACVSANRVPALDKRESGYSKQTVELTAKTNHSHQLRKSITYISDQSMDGNNECPILQSYLDAVLKGFLTEFGETGVRQFVETTTGWDAPILKDRDAPLYPRSVSIDPDEADFFEVEVKRADAHWIELD